MPPTRPPTPEALAMLHWLQDEAHYGRSYPATGSEAQRLMWWFIRRRIGRVVAWPVPQISGFPRDLLGEADVAGVSSIQAQGFGPLTGAVTLAPGSGISLSEAGQTITIAATGGAGGSDIWVERVTPWQFGTAVAGTWTWAADAAAFGDGFFWNSTMAQNDEITWPVSLSAGTWTLRVLYIKNVNVGIATFALGASTIGTVDGYAAGTVYNVASSIAGFVVATSGKFTFHMTMASKNASSSAYRWNGLAFMWERTA